MRLPPFVCQSTDLGHGRLDQREVKVFSIEPTQVELPHARTLVVVAKNSSSTGKSAKKSSEETVSFYLSSRLPGRAESFARLIRGHWGGSEIRNHWVRDALWAEDKTRSRNWTLNANLAILRACLVSVGYRHASSHPWPHIFELCSNRTGIARALLDGKPFK
jgi:predicted transposase YbfD/YdcC